MKIRERKEVPGGMGGSHPQERVREIPDEQKVPRRAEVVADETPEHDWRPAT
jgi:hypothetical protein